MKRHIHGTWARFSLHASDTVQCAGRCRLCQRRRSRHRSVDGTNSERSIRKTRDGNGDRCIRTVGRRSLPALAFETCVQRTWHGYLGGCQDRPGIRGTATSLPLSSVFIHRYVSARIPHGSFASSHRVVPSMLRQPLPLHRGRGMVSPSPLQPHRPSSRGSLHGHGRPTGGMLVSVRLRFGRERTWPAEGSLGGGGDKIAMLVSMVFTGHVSDEGKPSTTTSTTTCARETSRKA